MLIVGGWLARREPGVRPAEGALAVGLAAGGPLIGRNVIVLAAAVLQGWTTAAPAGNWASIRIAKPPIMIDMILSVRDMLNSLEKKSRHPPVEPVRGKPGRTWVERGGVAARASKNFPRAEL